MKTVVTFGEVMMRLSAPGQQRLAQTDRFNLVYAGAEANVAVGLSNFGIPSRHVTRFPDNDFGVAATRSLQRFGVDTDSIIYGSQRMGLYFLENGAMQRASRIVYDRFDSAFAHIQAGMIDWKEVLKDAGWFHWTGITPAVSLGAAEACKEAIAAANAMGITVSADINYRRVLWKYGKKATEVMPALIGASHIIVAGAGDVENCTGFKTDSFESAAAELQKSFPSVRQVVHVERESLSASHNRIQGKLSQGGRVFSSRVYDLTHIVDRIGAGDAFMSGLIFQHLKGGSPEKQIEFASAACALKHSVEGDVSLATSQEVEDLVQQKDIGKLLR